MFKRKTVFVVGAGGSKELGLPIGDELKDRIAAKVNIGFQGGFELSSGDVEIYHAVKQYMQSKNERDGNPYWSAGRSIAGAMPQALSIDNYLHAHYSDERLVMMGKLGISACILEAERRSSLFTDPHSASKHDFRKTSDTWHNVFCKMLTEGVQRRSLDRIFENVGIITFNYDRCIENYILKWLENYFLISDVEAQELVKGLTIIHPYGQIGQLSWQGKEMIPVSYGADVGSSTLFEISKNIRTFTEQVEDDAVPNAMKNLIAGSEQVVYLGFSFAAMNMQLMKLEYCRIPKRVFGTSMGLSNENLEVITRRLHGDMHTGEGYFLKGQNFSACKSVELLNNYFRVFTE